MPEPLDHGTALALSALWARLSHHPDPRAWQEAEAALITLRRIARQMGDPVPPLPTEATR